MIEERTRGAYKRGTRIVKEKLPEIDYEELTRVSTKYQLDEIAYRIKKLIKQKDALEKKYDELRQSL